MAASFTEKDAYEIKGVKEGVEERYDGGEMIARATEKQHVFPAKYFAKREDEKRIRLIQEYHRYLNTGDGKGEGKVPTVYSPTEEDYNVLLRKDAEKELYNFEGFLQSYFDVTNPIHQRLLKEVYPNYFERRLDVIKDHLEIQEKIARIKLFGVQTKEDIFFMYALTNGDIKIPSAPVFAIDSVTAPDEDAFERGFFNPKRYTGELHPAKTQLGTGANLFGSGSTLTNRGTPVSYTGIGDYFGKDRTGAGNQGTRMHSAFYGYPRRGAEPPLVTPEAAPIENN
jgi:hypothetical protein